MRINLVEWHREFKSIIHAQLELPSSLNHSLFVLFDLSLILDNLSCICNLFKSISISSIKEEYTWLFEKTEFFRIVIIKFKLFHDLMHLFLILFGFFALSFCHLFHQAILALLVIELLRRLLCHVLISAHVARTTQMHTWFFHATTAFKKLSSWFESLTWLFLVHLFIEVFDGLEACFHICYERLREFKFHRMMGERTLLTKLSDRFSIRGGPARKDIIRTLVLQGAHDCFVDDFVWVVGARLRSFVDWKWFQLLSKRLLFFLNPLDLVLCVLFPLPYLFDKVISFL